ncbi:MAG: MerR family transcriptional regulator [Steroidobacteraceae bacterium]
MTHEFTIEMLADCINCSVTIIRKYELEGLLPAATRSKGNQRIYDRSHLNRLSFIRNCRDFGIRTSEIKQLLGVLQTPLHNSEEVTKLMDHRLDKIARHLIDLRQLQRRLKQLRKLLRAAKPDTNSTIRGTENQLLSQSQTDETPSTNTPIN